MHIKTQGQNFGSIGSAAANIWVSTVENPMWNLATIDLADNFIKINIDKKKRNNFAGLETAFREMSGTAIVCLSSGLLGKPIALLTNKLYKPTIKTGTTWASDKALDVFYDAWRSGGDKADAHTFARNIFDNLSGLNGREIKTWSNIVSESEREEIAKEFAGLIKSRAKGVPKSLEKRIVDVWGLTERLSVKSAIRGNEAALETSLPNLLRDALDNGRDLFTNPGMKNVVKDGLDKIKTVNKIKTFGAVGMAIALALTNQTINRKLTKSKTDIEDFVGLPDYLERVKKKDGEKSKKDTLKFNLAKTACALGFLGMVLAVIRPKSFKQFMNQLELTGPSTGGVAIKTIFSTLVLGRIAAAKDKNELRETMTRDSACFISWLVLGGFVAKGAVNLLNRGRKNLFNETAGKGFKHWIDDVSLKSYAEIIAAGGKDKLKNIAKLTTGHLAGIAWSTIVFAIGVTNLNIWMTKKLHNKKQEQPARASAFSLDKKNLPEVFAAFK